MSRANAEEVRLALCSPGELWGGVEQFVESLARSLAAQDVSVLTIVFHDGMLYQRLRDAKIPVALITGRGPYDPTTVVKLRRLLAAHHINVLHTHGYKAAVLGGLASWWGGVRHVRTEHGQVEPWTGIARLKMRVNAWLARIASQLLTDAVVYVSEDIRDRSATSRRPALQEVIYNGIEQPVLPAIEAADLLAPGEAVTRIGIVGRISPVKGHLQLLHAAEQLRDLPHLRFYVLGSGPLEDECRRFCAERRLQNVNFLGFKRNIHDYLRQLDVLVMPSLHEGLPYTLLEAMYHKVPIIASAVGGLKEVIVDGVSGLLVQPGEGPALPEAIRHLDRSPELRRTLAENAHRLVCERFMIEQMASRYLDVYRRLLRRGNPQVRRLGWA